MINRCLVQVIKCKLLAVPLDSVTPLFVQLQCYVARLLVQLPSVTAPVARKNIIVAIVSQI